MPGCVAAPVPSSATSGSWVLRTASTICCVPCGTSSSTSAARDVLCYVIGRGDMLSELEELARALDIEKHVEFTGWVSPDELPTYLAAMDICIDPDPSNEYNDRCTMIKMMEYMALAKPIVAFDLPEHRVSAGEAALYAGGNDEREMARLIAELIDDPQRRATMGAIGRRRVESALAWQFQAANLMECYDRLADRGLRTRAATRPQAGYPSVSVTIVNHRARDLLRNCLRSLQRYPYTLGEMQIVVVDNASGDGSLEMVRSEFPEVLLRAESRRRGFGANQNRAVAAATGDVLFILNPDTEVHEHTIDRLVAALVAGVLSGAPAVPPSTPMGRTGRIVLMPFPRRGARMSGRSGLAGSRPTSDGAPVSCGEGGPAVALS